MPSPGDERELGVLIARLHTNPLDLSRPPLNFGFIGCRDTVPHLQRLAVQTGDALEELERALLR